MATATKESTERASQFLHDGLIDRAIQEYKKVLETDPNLIEVHERLAKTYLSVGKIKEALTEYNWLADHYLNHASMELAIANLREILSLDSDQLDARNKLAQAYLKQGNNRSATTERMILANKYIALNQKEKAVTLFQEILSADENNVDVRKRLISAGQTVFDKATLAKEYLSLCESYLKRQAPEKAITSFQGYNELYKEDAATQEKMAELLENSGFARESTEIYKQSAESYYSLKNSAKALAIYEKLLSLNPGDSSLQKRIENIKASPVLPKQETMKFEEAPVATPKPKTSVPSEKQDISGLQKTIEQSISSGSLDEARKNLLLMAEEQIKSKHVDDAITSLKKIVALAPKDIKAHEQLILLFKEKSKINELRDENIRFANEIIRSSSNENEGKLAEEAILSAIQIDPDHLDTYVKLVEFYERLRNREKSKKASMDLAHVALRQKKYDLVEQTCQKILGTDPGFVAAREILVELFKAKNTIPRAVEELSRLADQFLLKQSFEKAIETYQRALELDPQNSSIHKNLVVTYLQSGNISEAVKQCLLLGKLHQSLKAFPEAATVYRRALELDPNNYEAHLRLAEIATATGAKEDAAREYHELARLSLSAGNATQAIESLSKAISITPQVQEYYEEISEICLSQNQTSQSNKYLLQLADLKAKNQGVKDSIPVLQKILSTEPENIEALEKLAFAFESSNNQKQAVQEYTKAAELHQKKKNTPQAITAWSKALNLDKESPAIRENLVNQYIIVRRTNEATEQLLWLSNYYLNSNSNDKAISCAQRVLEINPQHIESQFVLAEIYSKQGDLPASLRSLEHIAEQAKKSKQWDTARSAYNKAIELDPENPRLRNQRIQIEVSSGNSSQTIEQYDSLGQLYIQKGSFPQACAAFEEALKLDTSNLSIRQKLTDLYVQQKDTKAFDALLKLADGYWESGQLEKTMETFKRALNTNSKDEKLLRSIANLHLQMDQQKEATDILYQLATLTLKKSPKDAALLAQEILQVDSGNFQGRQLLAEAYFKSGAKWDSVREYSVLADYYSKAGQFSNVIETYKTVLEIDPQNLDVYSKLVSVYESQKQTGELIPLLSKHARILIEKKIPDQATSILQKITTLDPSNLDAHKQLVDLFQSTGKTDKVVEQKLGLSEIYTKNGQYDLAIAELESAKALQPENTDILWNLIILYEQVHRVPELLKSYLYLGEIHEKKNSLAEAQDIYKKVLAIEPKDTKILAKSADLFLRQKANGEAARQFRILAEVYRETNQIDLAIESLNKALKINSEETEIYRTLVELYSQQGNKQKAIETLLTVADIYTNEGNSSNSVEAYQAVLSIDPEHIPARIKYAELCAKGNQPDLAAEQYRLLAQSHVKTNNLNDAINALKKVIQYTPQDAGIFIQLAELQIKTGAMASALSTYIDLAKLYTVKDEFSKAEEAYKKAISLDNSYIAAREGLIGLYKDQGKRAEEVEQIFQLADVFQQKNQMDKAVSYYQKITYLEPNNLSYREKIAAGYLRWNRPADAVSQLLEVATTHEKENSFESAIKVYQRILDIDPARLDVVQNIVRIQQSQNNAPAALDTLLKHAGKLLKAGKYDLAKDLQQKAIDLDPENPIPRQALIETLRKASRVTEAATQYSALVDLFIKTSQIDKAMLACRDAISFDSSNVIFRERLAEMALNSKQPAQATEQYLQLMGLYQSQNKTDDMIRSYERYLELNPRDSEIRERFMKSLERLNRNDALIKQHAIHARLLIEDGYSDKAIKYLKKPTRQFPEDVSLQLVLGEAYEKTGSRRYALSTYQELSKKFLSLKQYDQAILPLERLSLLEPDNLEVLQNLFKSAVEAKDISHVISSCERLVKSYTNRGDINSAISCLETVRNLDPNQISLREQLIELYKRAGNKESAIKERIGMADLYESSDKIPESIKLLISLIQDQPTNPDIHKKLLKLYLQTGQKKEAYKHYLDLSEIHSQQKQFVEAADSLKLAIALDPENSTAHLHLITLYRTTGQHQDAIDEYWKLGDLYEKSKQFNEAVRCYQQALELEPYSVDLHVALITIFQQQNKMAEVVSQYQLLAETYAQQNKFKDAASAYRKALDMDQKNAQIRLKLIETFLAESNSDAATQEYKILADQYLQSDNIESAIVAYIRLVELNEKNKELRKELAALYQRAGKMHEYAAEYLNLANLMLDEKQTQEAIPIFKDILEREPNNLHARNGLARAYVEMGDEKSALKEFLFVNQVLSKSGMGTAVHIERVKHAGIQLSPKFTFDNFVVGQHSNFAYATSLAVSKSPGRGYNPLFLYSEPGMGKTHLLNALGNYIHKNNSNLKIMYSTSESFTSELVNAIETNTVPEFRALYRNVDILLLEDVQFLGGKERAQEEFFHMFNVLIQSNKQVVLTSDRPPKELATLENRITSRFLGGIIIDIQKPDVETRMAILKQKVKAAKVKIDDPILDKIATSVDTNVRELEGALNKLLAYHENAKIEITMDLANNLLKDVLPSK